MKLIEREAAEREIAQLVPGLTTPDGSGQLDENMFCAQEMCADAIETIRELPNIEAAPVVHGLWIDTGCYVTTAYGSFDVYKCSVCGDDITIDGHDSYCPNCGAKMEGEKR